MKQNRTVAEGSIQRLKFYPQGGLLCLDSKVRRRYEESKSDKRSEPGLTEDYSSETSSERDGPEEGLKDKLPVQAAPAKPKMAFKIDISKCKIDNAPEIELEISTCLAMMG